MKYGLLLIIAFAFTACSVFEGGNSSDSLPSRYDLRDKNWVSPVKSQNGFNPDGRSDLGKSVGLCWAFASLASLESNLLKQGFAPGPQSPAANLSAWYLGNYIGYNRPSYEFNPYIIPGVDPPLTLGYLAEGFAWGGGGASGTWLTDYLISGKALPLESDYPMPLEAMTAMNALTLPPATNGHQYILNEMAILLVDDFANASDYRKAVKRYIRDHGAVQGFVHLEPVDFDGIESQTVGTQLYEGSRFMDKTNYNMYTYELDNLSTDLLTHAVSIVGWDDRRQISVGGNNTVGAWLIKDSASDKNWNEGYFWVAYDDPVANIISFGFEASPPGTYQHPSRYQTHMGGLSNLAHQNHSNGFGAFELGAMSYLLNGVPGQNSWAVARFNLSNNEQLAAVGIFTINRNEEIWLEVYKDSYTTSPLLTQSYKVKEMGYHLLKLKQDLSFSPGESIVIAIGFKHRSSQGRLPLVYVLYEDHFFEHNTWFGSKGDQGFSLTPYAEIGNSAYFMQAVTR